jgi:hypothetical protein
MLLQVIINSAIKMLLQQNSYCPKLAIVKNCYTLQIGELDIGMFKLQIPSCMLGYGEGS